MTTIYDLLVPTYSQMLAALSAQLHKAEKFAAAEGRDPAGMTAARLAPDMFPLAAQVRFVCFQVTSTVKELTGIEPPAAADDETTFAELLARIAAARDFLQSVPPSAFHGAEAKLIALTVQNGIVFDFTGEQFVRDWAIPQFYFHLVSAYAIMRNQGVALGKPDYVPHVLPYVRPGTMPG